MNLTTVMAIIVIEAHHVEHGVPSVIDMHEIRATIEIQGETGAEPAVLAHDTLTALGWRVEMVDGAIYRLKR